MGRIRTIKPEFPQSETMGRVSRDARLLFVQLWTQCDDAGRARAAPLLLRGTLFPYDEDVNAEAVSAWLEELARAGAIRLYSAAGDRYLEVVNWGKHQRIDRPSPSRIPGPFDADSVPFDESSTSPRRVLVTGLDMEGKGREGIGGDSEGSARGGPRVSDPLPANPEPRSKSASKGRSPEARGTRLPEDFQFGETELELARTSGLDPAAVLERFRDYWRGVAGAKGRKVDWQATARNWIRREAEDRAAKGGRDNGRRTRFEQVYGPARGS